MHLELDLVADAQPTEAVARVAALREPRTTIGGVNLVSGFRPELWAVASPDAAPPGVVGFNEPLIGPTGYVLPATQHDIVIWLTGSGYDVVFDLSRGVVTELEEVATLAEEMVGWPYHHDRDLTGFINRIENPPLMEAMRVALIPPGLACEGGSILLLQQWEHDAVGWERLPVATQAGFIGRRKPDSAELDPIPPASHVARTDQDRLGKIFRRNIAYGTLTRHGTIFVGSAATRGALRAMRESMLGADGGPPDKLLAVTRPLTGSYYVIPSADRLAAFDGEVGADA